MRESVDIIMPYIALGVVGALFTIPGIWMCIFVIAKLGHISQLFIKNRGKVSPSSVKEE